MRKLISLQIGYTVGYFQDAGQPDYWWITVDGEKTKLPFRLIKENNRGWTLESWLIGSGKTDVFLARGEWEIQEG